MLPEVVRIEDGVRAGTENTYSLPKHQLARADVCSRSFNSSLSDRGS
jgi:hypothetical protein